MPSPCCDRLFSRPLLPPLQVFPVWGQTILPGLRGSELGREPEGLGAVVAGEVGLKLPGREQHLGDAAQFDRVLTGVDGAGAGFERELAGKGEAVHGASKSQ